MDHEQLKAPPLVEVIFELRWRIRQLGESPAPSGQNWASPGVPPENVPDPSYDLLIGRLSKQLADTYSFHEKLASAEVPAYMVPFIVQHRFRSDGPESWPLVQIGPGIVTLNDITNYRWSDFLERALALLDALWAVHPQESEMAPESLVLRYMDAERLDYHRVDTLEFLQDNLKVRFGLPGSLFEGERVEKRPAGVNLSIVYPTTQPKGALQLRMATGQRRGEKAIIWETVVTSSKDDIPTLPEAAKQWLEEAHSLAHDWFFKLVEGELLKRYTGNG